MIRCSGAILVLLTDTSILRYLDQRCVVWLVDAGAGSAMLILGEVEGGDASSCFVRVPPTTFALRLTAYQLHYLFIT